MYANTAGHRKLRKLGQQSGAAAAFAGEVATGALVQEAGADKTTLARLSSLLQDEREDASLALDEDEDELLQEEADLKAAFARRAEELQAALKAGRIFLGGIEDTLEERLTMLCRDPTFTAPVWQEPSPLRPVPLKAMAPSTPQQRQRIRIVDASPVGQIPPARGPQEEGLSPSQPATPPMLPSPTLLPVALPLAAKVNGRVSVEFGNLDHIAAFARRRSHRMRSYDPVKRSAPLVEREIAALDDTPSAAQQNHKPLAPVMPSLWDGLTATAEEPVPAGKPALQSSLSSPLPSTPRQSGLWE